LTRHKWRVSCARFSRGSPGTIWQIVIVIEEEIMPRKITDQCTACGTCEPECPEGAIKPGDPCYVIDADKCTDCGICQDTCPTEAIVEE